MADQSGNVCNFFKKPSRNKNMRKRTSTESTESTEDDDDQQPQTSLPSQRTKKTLAPDKSLHFTTTSSSKSSDKKDDEQPELFHFESSKLIQIQTDSLATASLQTETAFDRDARAIRERILKRAADSLKGKSGSEGSSEKIYHGIHGYKDYKAGFRREQTVAGEKAGGAHGPLRASAHIRVSARFDYQPDICKDYKETGYCGYGDSCKFMHDRGDYKSGWQMENEWDEREKARKRELAMGGGGEDGGGCDDDDDDGNHELPFACSICRRPFEDPVETKCKHYFCEHCALKHHSKNKKCFVCNTPTLGIFNTAHEIRKKMAQEKGIVMVELMRYGKRWHKKRNSHDLHRRMSSSNSTMIVISSNGPMRTRSIQYL